jgi:catechol 2,3-dioxygenase-like lactoylglutathione lyase family enzyme
VRRIAFVLFLLAAVCAGQNRKRPYVGYLCAAGGQRGEVVRILAGGQSLRGAREVLISGEGVHGKVIRFRRPPWLLSPDDRRAVAQHLRRAGRKGKELPPLPDHPMLKNLESLTPKERRRVAYEFLDPRRRSQLSAQIAETVELEITIGKNAAPGDRELRIRTPRGLTNPVLFCVGTLPEFREVEPNDYRTARQPTVLAPCVLNGQVSFRDLDRFRIRARAGQTLVIEAQARRLVPYLADAVPGWFQATVAVYDAEGNELRFVDDHRFDPDPVVFFEVPEDGDYLIEIRDAIHRGREDFVYRITVAERPFVLSVFPLGARKGSVATARIEGWNLDGEKIRLVTGRGSDDIREAVWSRADLRTNAVLYAVGDLPERVEVESDEAQKVSVPVVVNGRIGKPGDVDWYEVRGRAGQEIVIEVQARRLGSPLDSLLRLVDAAGHVVAWNDDLPDKSAGLVTHQADSYLRTRLLANESYRIRVSDAQGHGGGSFAYRLRISKPRPDFAVLVTPASINVPAGGSAQVVAHVVRRDGFDGAIDLSLPDAPRGLVLSGARVPAGRDSIRMTLFAPRGRRGPPVPIEIIARAKVGGRSVRKRAVPAEDMMQAFGLRHLVPARVLFVDVTNNWRKVPLLRRKSGRLLEIREGGEATLDLAGGGLPDAGDMEFKLLDPPKGVFLAGWKKTRDGVALTLRAEHGKAVTGVRENLLVEAHLRMTLPKRGKKQPPKRLEVVLLPAVPLLVNAD